MWRFSQHENEGILAKLQSVGADVVANFSEAESELENTSSGVLVVAVSFCCLFVLERQRATKSWQRRRAQKHKESERRNKFTVIRIMDEVQMAAVLSSDHIRKLELTCSKKDEQLTRFNKVIRGWEETT